jgi:hypothetical protein
MRQQFRHVDDDRRPYLDHRNLVVLVLLMVCDMANQHLDRQDGHLVLQFRHLVAENLEVLRQIQDALHLDAHPTLVAERRPDLLDVHLVELDVPVAEELPQPRY